MSEEDNSNEKHFLETTTTTTTTNILVQEKKLTKKHFDHSKENSLYTEPTSKCYIGQGNNPEL